MSKKHERLVSLIKLIEKVEELHSQVVVEMSELLPCIKDRTLSNDELTDAGWLLRHGQSFLDETRKELKAKDALISNLLVFEAAKKTVANPSADTTYRGELASGTPDSKPRPKIPRRGTPEYNKLLLYLLGSNVDPNLIASGIFDFSFTQLSEFAEKRMSEGRPIPENVLGVFLEPTMTYRATKGKDRKTKG